MVIPYKEKTVSTRNAVIKEANVIIKEIMDTKRSYIMIWGEEKTMKGWLSGKKFKPKMTKDELRKGVFNFVRRHLRMEEV